MNAFLTSRSHHLQSALWVAALLSTAIALFAFPGTPPIPYRIDFDVYRTGGQIFLNGGDIYGELPELAHGDHLPFTYPPIAAMLFSIFAIMPMWLASMLFTAGSIWCVWWLTHFLVRNAESILSAHAPSLNFRSIFLLAITVALWFGPIRETLRLGQINLFLNALILFDLCASKRRPWTGALLGLAIAIKLTPAVFLLFFFLRRDWRSMLVTLLSFAVLTGIGYLIAPQPSVLYWTKILRDTARIGGLEYMSNQSINGMIARLGFSGSELSLAWLALSLAAGLMVAWVAWRLLKAGQVLSAAIVVGFTALLCSPVAWDHHWILAWPLLFLISVWSVTTADHRQIWRWLAITGALIFVVNPQWLLPHNDGLELEWAAAQHIVGDSYLWWSTAALTIIGVLAPNLPESFGPAFSSSPAHGSPA